MITINKRKVNSLVLTLTTYFMLLLCLSLSINAQTVQSVEDLVKLLSDGKLKVETRAVPYQLAGDFNGDKVKDIAVIVELLDLPKNISPAIKKVYPYYIKTVAQNDLIMLIIHGKGKGWQFAQKESILLLGRNGAMIFDKERLNEEGEKIEIEKTKDNKTRIFFSTEAASGALKWNGKKYIWSETQP